MSYRSIDQLTSDTVFIGRVRAVTVEQGESYQNDQRAQFVAVANGVLRGDGNLYDAFVRISAAGPGVGAKVDNGDGTIDQSKVTDEDLLSLTQANWQVVAALYFDADGNPNPVRGINV